MLISHRFDNVIYIYIYKYILNTPIHVGYIQIKKNLAQARTPELHMAHQGVQDVGEGSDHLQPDVVW